MLPGRLHIVPVPDTNERRDAAQDPAEVQGTPLRPPLSGQNRGNVIFKNMNLVVCNQLARFMWPYGGEDAGDSERGRGDGLSGLGRRSPRCAFRDTRPLTTTT